VQFSIDPNSANFQIRPRVERGARVKPPTIAVLLAIFFGVLSRPSPAVAQEGPRLRFEERLPTRRFEIHERRPRESDNDEVTVHRLQQDSPTKLEHSLVAPLVPQKPLEALYRSHELERTANPVISKRSPSLTPEQLFLHLPQRVKHVVWETPLDVSHSETTTHGQPQPFFLPQRTHYPTRIVSDRSQIAKERKNGELVLLALSKDPISAIPRLTQKIKTVRVVDNVASTIEEAKAIYGADKVSSNIDFLNQNLRRKELLGDSGPVEKLTAQPPAAPVADGQSIAAQFVQEISQQPEDQLTVIMTHVDEEGRILFTDASTLLVGPVSRANVLVIGCGTADRVDPRGGLAGPQVGFFEQLSPEDAFTVGKIVRTAAQKPNATLYSIFLELQKEMPKFISGVVAAPVSEIEIAHERASA
jgi:hypothetical protein